MTFQGFKRGYSGDDNNALKRQRMQEGGVPHIDLRLLIQSKVCLGNWFLKGDAWLCVFHLKFHL